MRHYLVILLVFFSGIVCSEEVFPPGCQAVILGEGDTVLSSEKPVLVMLHNLSKGDLWVTHPIAEPNMSAGWSTQLHAGNWSALMLQDKSFELSCIESKPGHEQQVACGDVLAICQWAESPKEQKNLGTFWVGENMKLPALLAYLERKGHRMDKAQNEMSTDPS